MSAQAINIPRNCLGELFVYWGLERGVYTPREVVRVSGERFVWPCTAGQDRGVGRCFLCILRDWRVQECGWGIHLMYPQYRYSSNKVLILVTVRAVNSY